MYCPECGASVKEGAKFYESCGARVDMFEAERPQAAEDYYDLGWRGIAPGYSRLIESDTVRAALKKQKRTGGIATAILIPLPLIGFLIYGAVSDSMEMGQAVFTGLVVSVIIALISLITGLKHKTDKPFEGTVTDMQTRYRERSDSSRNRTRHLIWLDCTDGKRRKKEVSLVVFNYLQVGDRVRYLPQFQQPFEKYDKSRDGEIVCMFCGRRQSIEQDACSFCHNPIIK